MSESAIQHLACLTYAPKVFVKLHRKVFLYGIQLHGAIIIIYTIAIHYPIAKNAYKHVHCRSHRQLQFPDPVHCELAISCTLQEADLERLGPRVSQEALS
jgi:hypothetical protein